MRTVLILALTLSLGACKDEAALPDPVVMTDEALGHYCQMYLSDHTGPKAQAFLDGYHQPVWFSQVSDAAAYRDDREKPAPIAVIYVSDMGAAESWAVAGPANWISAETASYVIDSRQTGGMGLPEAIPFGRLPDAEAFAAKHGGRVVAWADIPPGYGQIVPGDGPIRPPETLVGQETDGEFGE
ncbi:nitrous oxide reductase accessory protein NosL [Frigidibacter sp. ROC022]|uniref:nitrous oxide reductase accessory protein NosL n=1 Tax=Frigidibacter sp. ROC022 TaxID=2971796 RepID=UPI00215B1D33|nr:nitrous oxide reductase accessory protein NosL [Frigidibacter sp. ROC022]MCR8726117.1 nitrous oxide reductase accessory protein NosL [Frigidibacter sp. ROC022]